MTELVIPGVGRRMASLFYELLLLVAVLLGGSALLTPLKAVLPPGMLTETLFRVLLAAVLFAYLGLSWVKSGQTVGMKTWRLKLVDRNGILLRWPHALLRYLVALALFVGVPAVAYLVWAPLMSSLPRALGAALAWWLLPIASAFIDPERLFLHDRLAGTRVVLLPLRRPKAA